jgi:hypothetical protein
MPGGKFTDSLITENLKVATEYFKATVANVQNDAVSKIKNSGGSIGFIPFKINFTMDGLSGIKIYNELVLDTSFLPQGYSKTLKFIVTGVDHKLSKNDWETTIHTTLIPTTSNVSKITGSLKFSLQEEVTPEIPEVKNENLEKKESVGGTGPKALGTYGTAGPNGPVSPDALTLAAIDQIVTDSGTSNDLRKRIIKIAASYVGQYELPPPPTQGDGWNEGWYDRRFENKMLSLKSPWQKGQPWCNWFTNLCWTEAYTTGNALVPSTTSYQSIWNTKLGGGEWGKPLTPGVSNTYAGFQKLGQAITISQAKSGTNLPEPGDMVMFHYSTGKHIEIVVAIKVNNGKLTGISSIGGNTSANNNDRDGGATKYKPNVSLGTITGFGKVIF